MLLIVALISVMDAYSQDSQKLKDIDSVVYGIKNSGFPATHDSITQNYPGLGLFMTSYLTKVMNSVEIKCYVNKVHSRSIGNGLTREMTTFSSFYFDHHKLIKVEESGVNKNNEDIHVAWYYADSKPIYNTAPSGKSQDRAEFLLVLADIILKQSEK